MRALARRLRMVLAGISLLATFGIVGIVGAGPASAAGTFVNPSSAFTVAADSNGEPVPPDITTSNFPAATAVFIIVCDGKSPSAPGYDVGADCDNTTAPTQIISQGPSYQEQFTNANNSNTLFPFRGLGGSKKFNCLAPEDVKSGATVNPAIGGDVVPIGSKTKNGDTIGTTVPSWDNCQVRVASNNASVTSDQSYLTFTLSNTGGSGPGNALPETPLAVALPIGAVGLFAAGFAINRRRRSNAA